MKILHVIAPGAIADAEKSALKSIEALRDADQSAVLVCITDSRVPRYGQDFTALALNRGVPTTEVVTRGRVDFGIVGRIHRIAASGQYDVVHTHGYKALAFVLAGGPSRSAIVATYHGATSVTPAVRLYEWIEWALFQRVSCLFSVSEQALETLESRGRLRCPKAIVPNMLSETIPAPPPPETKLHGEPVRLLFLGRLSFEKGADLLIDALDRVPPDVPLRLTVLGDGPERNRLVQDVAKKHLERRVSFKGFCPHILEELMSADVVVMPSRTEGLPMALIEAASAGKPVVASRVGGIPDIIEHNANGLLVPHDDATSLANALQEMVARLFEFQSESIRRARDVQNTYSPRKWAELALREYDRAIINSNY